MTNVFAAVADPTRRDILGRLRISGELSIKDLSAHFAITRQAVTKHLRMLEDAGLVHGEQRGRERLHRLDAQPLEEIDTWLRPYSAAWDRRLSRLRKHLGDLDEN